MCENLQYYFESVYFKELHKDQSYNWPITYGAGAAVVSTITSVNTELSSLRKQPTFGGATTCFPAKSWRVRNERRNSILMTHHHPDLGCASDWLKQVSYRGTTNQKHYPDLGSGSSSVWNSALISQTSFRGETSGDVTKCQLFSHALN